MKPTSQAASIALHTAVILLLLFWPATQYRPDALPRPDDPFRARTLLWRPPLTAAASPAARDGGGARQPLLATRGAVPQVIRPFLPPKVQVETPAQPKLILASGVDIPVPRIDMPQLGDPNSQFTAAAPSGGPGAGQSIGNSGTGPLGNHGGTSPQGDGPGGKGAVKILGATPPALIHKVEPDYSDDARRVRLQGSVLLAIDVDAQGRVTNIRVLRPLGMGLDERAVEAVAKWRFKPARKDGRDIPYPAAIEVHFQLL